MRRAATSTSRSPGPATARRAAGCRATSSSRTVRRPGALRPWPLLGGSARTCRAGRSRPATPAENADAGARAVADAARGRGVDVVAVDAEVPARPGVRECARGGRVPPDRGDPAVAAPDVARRSRGATRRPRSRGSRSRRASGSAAPRATASPSSATTRACAGGVGEGFVAPPEPTQVALDRFYDLLLETGERRQFSFGPRESFVALVDGGAPRRAPRLPRGPRTGTAIRSPACSCTGTAAASRRSTPATTSPRASDHPGALHLLRWRAIQLAIRESRDEMDLGGVDVAGARREPHEGEPMYGLYQHKRSFGADWVELAGAHEKVIRAPLPRGRVVARLSRLLDRRPQRMRRTKRAKGDDDRTIADLLAAAEPAEPRPLGDLIERLRRRPARRRPRRRPRDRPGGARRRRGPRRHRRHPRAVAPGALFVAIPGEHVDGHDLLADAAAAAPPPRSSSAPSPRVALPQLVVAVDRRRPSPTPPPGGTATRAATSASIGITGTDGKTTTSFLAVAALEAAGLSTGLVGTVERRSGRSARPTRSTSRPRARPTSSERCGRWPRRATGRPSSRPRRTAWPRIASGRSPTTRRS